MSRAGTFWVFGYGSLMWDPGFDHVAASDGLVRGWRRHWGIYSHEAWGTPERPGLVLTLVAGGSVRGRAFEIPARDQDRVTAYLDRRESAYMRRRVQVDLGGRRIDALTYVVDRHHPRYAGRLSLERAAAHIADGVGRKGSSLEYLAKMVSLLGGWGLNHTGAHDLLAAARSLGGACTRTGP